MRFAWYNLVYGDVALALVLACQLQSVSQHDVVFGVAGPISDEQVRALRCLGGDVQFIEPIDLHAEGESNYRYSLTMTKLRFWQPGRYEQVCIIDSDILFLQSPDSIPKLDAAEDFSAVGVKDRKFNSGVMVVRPGPGIYRRLMEFHRHYDLVDKLPDQAFLNRFWAQESSATELPERYNIRTLANLDEDGVVYHFADKKPWIVQHRQYFSEHCPELLDQWDAAVAETTARLRRQGFDADALMDSLRHRSIKYFLDRQFAELAKRGLG